MHPQTDLFFYKFRSVFLGLSIIAFFVAISALVTNVGSHTVLDPKTNAAASLLNSTPSDSPNAVTDGVGALMSGSQRVLLAMGTAFYRTCRSITNTSAQAGKATGHVSSVIAGGVWHGATFVTHGIASGFACAFRTMGAAAMFTIRAPGRAVGSVTHTNVSTLIRPADSTSKKTVPVISSETSAAILASYNAQQRQQITDWQTAQAAANRGLGGSIVAGDPHHGGYPAKWDNAAQDRLTDSWGMYNRECVSYAAWKVFQTYGSMPYWGGVGNANQWVRDARKAGIPTGSTPQVHSVAISMQGYYGHAMWVEAVKGSMIYVSQYNYDLHGHYSEMWVNSSSFTYIYFK